MSAMALADALAFLIELGDLTVTLKDVAIQALMMDGERLAAWCECGALDVAG